MELPVQKCHCGYCEKKKFPLLWNIPKHDFLWLEIPKSGSWIMKQHFKIDKQEQFIVRDYAKAKGQKIIVIVRDPIERFRSMYGHYFTPDGLRYKFVEKMMQGRDPYDPKTVDFVLDNLHRLNTTHQSHHFYPQSYFVPESLMPQVECVWIQELTDKLGVPKGNATKNVEQVKFTSEQEHRISLIYRQDYQMLSGLMTR